MMILSAALLVFAAATADVSDAPGIPPEAERTRQMQDILQLDDAGIDAQFQCPETLPAPVDEIWKIGLFLYWAKNKHPDWTTDQAIEARHRLFVRHQCVGLGGS